MQSCIGLSRPVRGSQGTRMARYGTRVLPDLPRVCVLPRQPHQSLVSTSRRYPVGMTKREVRGSARSVTYLALALVPLALLMVRIGELGGRPAEQGESGWELVLLTLATSVVACAIFFGALSAYFGGRIAVGLARVQAIHPDSLVVASSINESQRRVLDSEAGRAKPRRPGYFIIAANLDGVSVWFGRTPVLAAQFPSPVTFRVGQYSTYAVTVPAVCVDFFSDAGRESLTFLPLHPERRLLPRRFGEVEVASLVQALNRQLARGMTQPE